MLHHPRGDCRVHAERSPIKNRRPPDLIPRSAPVNLILSRRRSPAADDWTRFGEPESRSPVAILTAPEKPAPATWGRRRALVRILSVGLAHPKPGARKSNTGRTGN